VQILGRKIEVESILILHQGALGDFILALPTLANLREAFPKAKSVIMGYPRILELVEKRFYAEEILSIDQKGMATFFVRGGPLDRVLSRFFSQLDLVVVFGKGGGVTLVDNLKRVCRGPILPIYSFPPWGHRIHLSDHLLSELARFGFPVAVKNPEIRLNEADRQWGRAFWQRQGLGPEERAQAIILHPGSGSRKKVWPPDRFQALGHHLEKRLQSRLLVVIGPAETEETEIALQKMPPPPRIFAKDLSLLQLASVMEGCRLFIGNDSGVSHLAAALGLPVLALFGPTDPAVWSPRGRKVVVVRREIPCSPCPEEKFFQCKQWDCMNEVGFGDVLKGLEEIGITS
ncbi:MAG: glycosyltransferase family 9 protein, partial [Deltaproteobacteria bacterium]